MKITYDDNHQIIAFNSFAETLTKKNDLGFN